MTLLEKLPKPSKLWPVYAVIVLMIYGWTIRWFIWKLSSWLYYLRLDEILAILSYAFTVDLLESLLVLGLIVALALILPKAWFEEEFVARGTLLALLGLGYSIYIASLFQDRNDFPRSFILRSFPVALIASLLLSYAAPRLRWAKWALEEFANRATIFLYILVPLSLISLLIVIWRNLF